MGLMSFGSIFICLLGNMLITQTERDQLTFEGFPFQKGFMSAEEMLGN